MANNATDELQIHSLACLFAIRIGESEQFFLHHCDLVKRPLFLSSAAVKKCDLDSVSMSA